MDGANRVISGMVDAATNPSRAGALEQSGALSGTREDARHMYAALQPFRDLFPASEPRIRSYPSRPLPWSSASMPTASPTDLSSFMGRTKQMFPSGVPSGSGAAGLSDSGGQLQALYDNAQQLLLSGDPAQQLQGQQMLQQYQTMVTLFSTLLQIQASTQKVVIGNLRSS